MVKERGNGNIETNNIELESFDEVKFGGGFDVTLEEAGKPGLKIVTDENLMDYIRAEVRGSQLHIYTTDPISSKKGVNLYLRYTDLSKIEVSGAVSMTNDGVLKSDELRLSLSGAGSVDMELEVEVLDMSLSGAGAVELKGAANEQYVKMSGAGGLDAFDLASKECEISISGVGGANVHVTERLKASVSGIGSISYSGNPEDVTSNVSGLGSISRED